MFVVVMIFFILIFLNKKRLLMNVLHGFAESVNYAMRNPFGYEFKVNDKEISITLGSALNSLGYNDALERIVGVSRVALGLVALTVSKDLKTRAICSAQIFRGILEMMGNFENYLLIADIAFSAFNIGYHLLSKQNDKPGDFPIYPVSPKDKFSEEPAQI